MCERKQEESSVLFAVPEEEARSWGRNTEPHQSKTLCDEDTTGHDHTKDSNEPFLQPRPRSQNHNVYCKITAS